MCDVRILRRPASAEEYMEMRRWAGWSYIEKDVVATGLKNSLFSLCVQKGEEVVGHGRIIGDGAFTLYIQDVIVKPAHQGSGIGTIIMDEIMNHIEEEYPEGTMVCLLAAVGTEGFYTKFGFIERPNEVYGAGMIQFMGATGES